MKSSSTTSGTAGIYNKAGQSCYCVVQAPLVIHTPHALPMFKEAKQIRKRKSERDHDDAVKFHKPEVGSSAATLGRGAAGLIGKTGGTLLTQYILKNHVSSPTLLACAMPQESCKSLELACVCCVINFYTCYLQCWSCCLIYFSCQKLPKTLEFFQKFNMH